MSNIKLLVIDENDEFRAPLEQYTHTVLAIKFLGVKTDIAELTESYDGESPDLVLCASALIKTHGSELVGTLRTQWPYAMVYRLTVFDDSGYHKYDSLNMLDGSIPRARIEDHLDAIVETFTFDSKEPLN